MKDFAVLREEFPRRQIDAYGRVSSAQWQRAMEELQALPIERLSDAQIAWHIERPLALYHDGHIAVQTDGSKAEPEFLPVRFRWFAEGMYVMSSSEPAWLGARLLQPGDVPASELPQRIQPWVSVENEPGLHAAVYRALSNAALLVDARIAPDGKPIRATLRLLSGEERTVVLQPRPYAQIHWITGKELPRYRQERTPANWMEVLSADHVVYVRYAECRDRDRSEQIAGEIKAVLKQDRFARVVVDLRGNEGGDSAAFAPILDALCGAQAGGGSRVVALTDRNTFSSAFRNAVELKRAGAVVVGEASSQRPVYTGNVKSFQLPDSQLSIRYTTKWSKMGAADAMEMTPDVIVVPTPEQYMRGEDPALQRALGVARAM